MGQCEPMAGIFIGCTLRKSRWFLAAIITHKPQLLYDLLLIEQYQCLITTENYLWLLR